jgi:hypothetical protein
MKHKLVVPNRKEFPARKGDIPMLVDGKQYLRFKSHSFFWPAKFDRDNEDGYTFYHILENSNLPIVCQCGNDTFHITHQSYKTANAKCTKCGTTDNVSRR